MSAPAAFSIHFILTFLAIPIGFFLWRLFWLAMALERLTNELERLVRDIRNRRGGVQ